MKAREQEPTCCTDRIAEEVERMQGNGPQYKASIEQSVRNDGARTSMASVARLRKNDKASNSGSGWGLGPMGSRDNCRLKFS